MDTSAREHEHEQEAAPAPVFRHSPSRCPYCHDALGDDDDVAACRRCLAPHHLACWREAGACGTCRGERYLHETGMPSAPRRAALREYVAAIDREPRWVRLGLGPLFLLLALASALFGAFVVYRAFVAPFEGPVEWLILLPLTLVMFSAFPGWVCWRAAQLRLWPTPEPSVEPAQAPTPGKDKAGAD